MKILIIVTNADLAGAPIHVLELVRGLSRLGVEILLVTGEDGFLVEQVSLLGIQTQIISSMRSNISPIKDLVSFFSLRRYIINFRPDLVHAHSSKAGLIARAVGAVTRIPVVYTVHGWGYGVGRRKSVSILVYITEFLMKSFTRKYIAVSDADAQMGRAHLRIRSNRIVTIHNGISLSTETVASPISEFNIIMVARDDPQKDYDTLFKALAISKFDQCFVVGRGTDAEAFKARAYKFAGDSVNKIGFLGVRSDIHGLLSMSSVFILSSNFEGLPLSIIEAMGNGLPIIATDVGGVSELVENEINGFLIQAKDHKALARYLSELFNNPELRIRLGENSLNLFNQKFSADTMIKKVLSVYQEVLQSDCSAKFD